MDARARSDFAPHAAQLRPLLNRFVFYGIETCRGFLDSRELVRWPALPVRNIRVLTTSPLTRLATELVAAGFHRIGKADGAERWEATTGLALYLESSSDATGEDADSGILEYATLMTVSMTLESGDSLRVSALPGQIALLWRSHLRSGLEFSASPWAEDMIELVVRRSSIRDDVAALPAELRTTIARSAAAFAASEAAIWTLESAIPDARATPGVAAIALDRFRAIAALAA
jgi:hypothetical protein